MKTLASHTLKWLGVLVVSVNLQAQTFVNGGASGYVSANNCVLTLNVTAGNIIWFLGSTSTVPNTLSISDANSNTYSQIYGPHTSGTTTPNIINSVWRTTVGTTNAALVITFNVTSDANWYSCAAVQFLGSDTPTTLDKTATVDSSGPITPGNNVVTGTTATTAVANELLIAFYSAGPSSQPAVWTAGSGWTKRADSGAGTGDVQSIILTRVVSSTGAYQGVVTSDINVNGHSATILTFKASGGGGSRRRANIL